MTPLNLTTLSGHNETLPSQIIPSYAQTRHKPKRTPKESQVHLKFDQQNEGMRSAGIENPWKGEPNPNSINMKSQKKNEQGSTRIIINEL